jgi:hypothetical protein
MAPDRPTPMVAVVVPAWNAAKTLARHRRNDRPRVTLGSLDRGQQVQRILAIKARRGRSLRLEFEMGNVRVARAWPRLWVKVPANGAQGAPWEFGDAGVTTAPIQALEFSAQTH